MKYAISNLAWVPSEQEKIYSLMEKYNFEGLEIVPSLFINSNSPFDGKKEYFLTAKNLTDKYNLSIVSMQSILFGSNNLFLFQDDLCRKNLLNFCKKVIDSAYLLKITNIVFGAPKNRIIPDNMSPEEAEKNAIYFFKELGDYAYKFNTCIGIEANASRYGGNFITKTIQAIDLIKKVNSKGFMLNLDFSTMNLENEPMELIKQALPYINHIHISEDSLAPIYEGDLTKHIGRAKLLKKINYTKYISIEMKAISEKDNSNHVKKSLEFISKIYK